MSIKLPWKKLKNLVSYDREFLVVEEQIKQAEDCIAEKSNIIQLLTAKLNASKQECHDCKKQVDAVELQARELKEEEEAKKRTLQNTHNEKEYRAINKEIKNLATHIMQQEDEVVAAWGKLEQAEKTMKAMEESYLNKTSDLKNEISQYQEQISKCKQELTEKENARSTLTQDIPEEVLTQYARMRNQVEDPIVPITGNACSSCFYNILAHDLNQLKKNVGMVHCKSCYRLLYLDDTTGEAPAGADNENEETTPSKT